MARTAISIADGPMEAAKLVVSELSGKDKWPVFDSMAVGSLKTFGKVEPVEKVVTLEEAGEDQPFPEASAPLGPAAALRPSAPAMIPRQQTSSLRRATLRSDGIKGAVKPLESDRFQPQR